MLRYITLRVAQGVVVLWAAYTVSFFVLYMLPGDPAELMVAGATGELSGVDQTQVDQLRAELGLDKPLIVQYLHALWNAVHLDFGASYQTGVPVSQAIGAVLPNTLVLGGTALLIATILGVALAVATASTRSTWLRQGLAALPPLAVSIPGFWIGLLLLQLFSFRLGWFPAVSSGPGLESLVLPAIAMAIPTSAFIAQLLSRSLLHTLDEPYIEIARAKGVGHTRLLYRHAIRNAVIPVITMVGMLVGGLFAGATITETVFSRPGIGRLMVTAVNAQDIPVVQGLVVLAATVFVLTSLIVDLLYPFIDPRIQVVLRRRTREAVA